MCPKPAHPLSAVWPEWDASWHAHHDSSLLIYYHALTRQMEHASSNHQLHEQRYTPTCIIYILCVLPNLHITSRSAGCCRAGKRGVLIYSLCPKLVNPLPYTQKANGRCQQQSSTPWTVVHTTMHHIYPVGFSKSVQKQHIQCVLWDLKGMHPDMQVMS